MSSESDFCLLSDDLLFVLIRPSGLTGRQILRISYLANSCVLTSRCQNTRGLATKEDRSLGFLQSRNASLSFVAMVYSVYVFRCGSCSYNNYEVWLEHAATKNHGRLGVLQIVTPLSPFVAMISSMYVFSRCGSCSYNNYEVWLEHAATKNHGRLGVFQSVRPLSPFVAMISPVYVFSRCGSCSCNNSEV